MGLNIREIIPRKEIEIDSLNGKTICVDAYNTLYQFLSTIRQTDGTSLMDSKGEITSHLSGIFYRNVNLLSKGIKMIYVFDGKAPTAKLKTRQNREEIKREAYQKYVEARDEDDIASMRKYSQQLSRLSDKMIEESKELLEAMGIAVVQAPGEGEAEAAHLCKMNKEIYAVASQDYDSLLFGAPVLIQNLTLANRRKTFSGYVEVKPQMIELEKVLNFLEIDLDQLICIGILIGTDYNPKGIPGIGQKRALDIVKRYKSPVLIFKSLEEQIMGLPEGDRFEWKEIFKLFRQADVKYFDFEFKKIDEEKIKEILVKRHDFSEERVEKQLEKLRKFHEESKQKGLEKWF